MATTIDVLRVRKVLGRDQWLPPVPFGPDGWRLDCRTGNRRVIVTASEIGDDGDTTVWLHASMSRADDVPSYAELALLHEAVWRDGYAYQVFAPTADHINIHPNALHLWGRQDGARVLPDFGWLGSI